MSGVSLSAVGGGCDDGSGRRKMSEDEDEEKWSSVVGGVMGSLRVIELQLVAFIMVFSASGGLVPLFDLAFPAFTTAYLLLLSRLAFPSHRSTCSSMISSSSSSSSSRSSCGGGSGRMFGAYVMLGSTVGLFLPLAYVLGGFARGDEHSVASATPHLFLLSCQILTENVITALSLFSPPVRALVPLMYTVRRIFLILDWLQHVWINDTSLPPYAHIKDVAWFWFGRVLALGNLAYFSINLLVFLIPRFLPRAFNQYLMEENDIHRNKAEDKHLHPSSSPAPAPPPPPPPPPLDKKSN